MRSNALIALTALIALPFSVSAASAAPAGADVARAAKIDTRSHIVDVRKGGGPGMRGGGGFKGGAMRGGGFRGGKAFRGAGSGPRMAFRGGRGHGHGKHWHGGHGHHHHGHHHHFRPRWYGVPYYGSYYSDPYYYSDSYYYDDGDDDAVVYANDGDAVARCASRYRSFDARTGTYLNNDGNRYLCPYLR